jgi:hypothetical protein
MPAAFFGHVSLASPFPPRPRRGLLGLKGPFNEALMMTSRTPGVDPGVKIRGGLTILMRQQFFDGIEMTQLGIEHDLCTQMAELMRRKMPARRLR